MGKTEILNDVLRRIITMKKAVAISLLIAVAAMMNVSAFADVDLSGMSFDELVALKDQINLTIWNSEEWQEVEVPQGVWEVGADIPEGKWTIRATDGNNAYVTVGTRLDESETEVDGLIGFESLKSETRRGYNESSDVSNWTIELKEGQYMKVDFGNVIFTPYAGKPSLGFKK